MKRLSWFFLRLMIVFSIVVGCTPTAPPPSATSAPVAPSPSPTLSPVPSATQTVTSTATRLPPTQTPIPRVLLPVRGIIGPFERRGFPSGYYEGQIIRELNHLDPVVGSTVGQEVERQLDAMRSIGINTITLTLSAADAAPGAFVPPACTINPDLGLLWPQPTELELANLKALFDLIHAKGINIILNLSNTHMEEQPPTNSETWLGAILKAVKDHPALELVMFGGDAHTLYYPGSGSPAMCGGRAEPNLGQGPNTLVTRYLKWALTYAHSLGLPYRKLSAEVILGAYISVAQQPNQYMTDGHFWNPEVVLKGIFDELKIPDDQRTYAISFYEQHKCAVASDLPCVDLNPHAWALETINRLFDTIGRGNGARVIAVETGYLTPKVKDWNTELALESLIWIYQNYGVDGTGVWLWTNSDNGGDLDPARTPAIKLRGIEFNYNPVKDILQQLYTEGQTNDLKLTPDAVPPVFASVSTTPTVVKNGDTLDISANLGETHLFVWVEMSALDSDKTGLVVLMDQGDGTYKRQVSLSPWNTARNGMVSLKITAMDFWSNLASTTVKVELNNPAPAVDGVAPDDNFDGGTLDLKKWRSDLFGGAAVTQDKRLIISTDSHAPYSAGSVSSTWNFPGDFDVQVDFQIGEGWQTPTREHLDGAFLEVDIAGKSYRVTRLRSDSEDKVFTMNSADEITGEMATSAVTGSYRLIRIGSTLIVLFDVGAGWQKIASKTVNAGAAQIVMGNGSINASQAFTTYFDNFQINSGLTTYKP